MYDMSMGKSFHSKIVNLMFLRNAVKGINRNKNNNVRHKFYGGPNNGPVVQLV